MEGCRGTYSAVIRRSCSPFVGRLQMINNLSAAEDSEDGTCLLADIDSVLLALDEWATRSLATKG